MEKPETPTKPKLPYSKPQLIEYGSLSEKTKMLGNNPDEDFDGGWGDNHHHHPSHIWWF